MPQERKPPRDAMSQRHIANFVKALGDTVPPGSRDAALYSLAADDYGRGSNGRDLGMDLLNPALYASIAATLGANWLPAEGGQGFVDRLVGGLPSEAFLEAAGGRLSAPAPAPSPPTPPQRRGVGPISPFMTQVQSGPGQPQPGRPSRRLDGPPRRLTEEEKRQENIRLYGNPDGPPDPSARRSRAVPPRTLITRRRQTEGGEHTIEAPPPGQRGLPIEGPPR